MRVSEHYVEDLAGLLTYDLSDGATAEVIEHLRACGECRRDLVEALADSYPPQIVLPSRVTRPRARQTRRTDLIFACLVLLTWMTVILLAILIR
jgi:hypothetical protein